MHAQILVPQKYSARQVKLADTKRTEFKPTRYTSGSANLDDMVATGRAVILCTTHARKFKPKEAKYRPHPAKNMRRVRGNCDVCQQFDLSHLFINEKQAEEELRKVEKFRIAAEYGRFYRG